MSFDLKTFKDRMDGALTSLKGEFSGLRTGRANAALLNNIRVMAYGSEVPLNQVGGVNVPDPRMITISVYDKTQIGAVEKALRQSTLGFNPVVDGTTIRLPMPPLTEERRRELTKIASGYTENARIAVRNVRRDAMDSLKKLEKAKEISEDESRAHSDDVQKATDATIKAVDSALEVKSEEIMQV